MNGKNDLPNFCHIFCYATSVGLEIAEIPEEINDLYWPNPRPSGLIFYWKTKTSLLVQRLLFTQAVGIIKFKLSTMLWRLVAVFIIKQI